jgi:NarL family two-component system sensor histidine kinase LiaS
LYALIGGSIVHNWTSLDQIHDSGSGTTLMTSFLQGSRNLRWKLTLSYTAVTVGSLLLIVFLLGLMLFTRVLVPLDILNSVLSPKAWIEMVSMNTPPEWGYVLSQRPVDTHLVQMVLRSDDLQVTHFDLFRIGDLQVRMRTTGQGSVLLVDPDGILLGSSNTRLATQDMVGKPLNTEILPGLESPLQAASQGVTDPERLFVTLEENERFFFALPYLDEENAEVLGVGIIYFENIPTENDIISNTWILLSRSALILLFAAGIIGAVFGSLTARNMVARLQHVSHVADQWSRGDFSDTIEDPNEDEIGQLGTRLNRMASQLKDLLKRRQEMAVAEERNRLARDLHDSAKQQALAASFQIGTALTLFNREPQNARVHLKEAEHLVDSVREELTDLILELRPQSLEEKAIDEILSGYAIDWSHQHNIELVLDLEFDLELNLIQKQTLLRITQEALANVARHSDASAVSISLKCDDRNVTLTIKDEGRGFILEETGGGMGLNSMRERSEALGGYMQIESAPAAGTILTFVIPT